MTGGWQGHLARVERWYNRSTTAHDEHDQIDFLFAFFENSFALRDWLIDTGAISKQEVDSLFSKHAELRINRDLPNSLKHHSITSPSQEQPPSIAIEYSPEYPTFGSDCRIVVLSEGRKYEALALAKRCLEIWRQYLNEVAGAIALNAIPESTHQNPNHPLPMRSPSLATAPRLCYRELRR